MYTVESTGATMERTNMSNLRNGNKGDSNPGSLDCESGILPLSYRAPHVAENDTLFWRGSNYVSRFEFIAIQPEFTNAQLYALGLSSKTGVHGFDSKLLCLCSDSLTPIITAFTNTSLETNRVLND